jgi:hypothetical protein
MSFAITAAVTAVVGTTYSIYAGERAADQQKQAQAQAKTEAEKQAKLSDIANNRANQKKADVAGLLKANQDAAGGGGSGTMLTGPSGVDVGSLNLGKNTLLGA